RPDGLRLGEGRRGVAGEAAEEVMRPSPSACEVYAPPSQALGLGQPRYFAGTILSGSRQTTASPSVPVVTACRPSGDRATARTCPACSVRPGTAAPPATGQAYTALSRDPASTNRPSRVNATPSTCCFGPAF